MYAFPSVLLSRQNKVAASRNVEADAALAVVGATPAEAGRAVTHTNDPNVANNVNTALAVFVLVMICSPFLRGLQHLQRPSVPEVTELRSVIASPSTGAAHHGW